MRRKSRCGFEFRSPQKGVKMKAEVVMRDERSEYAHPAIRLTPENDLEIELLERFAKLSGQMDKCVVVLPEDGGSYELGILFLSI